MVSALRSAARILLLAFVGGTCALATHAAAAPAPTLFKLTVAGTAQQQWTYTAAPVTEGACTRIETSEGMRSASFRTSRPVIVRISGGKVLPVTIRGIRGTVTLGGANTTDTRCGSTGTTRTSDCAQTQRAFTGATLTAVSRKPGYLSVNPIANVQLARTDCPIEPPDVIGRPLGPAPKVLRMPQEVLRERKLESITLRASPSRETSFGSPEKGRLQETSEWRFTFVRVRG
jgi:hypothetical protein